jgi:hypothetical protein
MEEDKKPIAIDISYHFMKRTVERVHKITHLDHLQMRDHVSNHKLALMEQALYMFGLSEFLWQGVLHEKYPIANYYVYEHHVEKRSYIVVADLARTNLITIYPIEFSNLPSFMAKSFERKLLGRVSRLQMRQRKLMDHKRPLFQDRHERIRAAENKIKALEQEIESQRRKIESHKQVMQNAEQSVNHLKEERGEITRLLCSSKFISKDLFEWKENKDM